MVFSVEAIPTWALSYLINDDRSGLTEEEVRMIDHWYNRNKVVTISTASEDEGECFPYFSRVPAFGSPTEVVDCSVMIL